MNWTLELVMVPVSDVDRAKTFYVDQVGFEVLVDNRAGEHFRIVQLNPPGSACAIAFGAGMPQAAPGSVQGLHLCVSDIEAAHVQLAEGGVETSGLFHFVEGAQTPGPDPERQDYGTFLSFSDPDGNMWLVQEVRRQAAPPMAQA